MTSTTPTARFPIKIDNLPKLSIRGDNFSTWKNAWTIALHAIGLHDIVTQSDGPDDKKYEGLAVIMQSVESDFINFVVGFDHPAKAWKALCDRYDRDTGLSTVHLLRAIMKIDMTSDSSLREHVDVS